MSMKSLLIVPSVLGACFVVYGCAETADKPAEDSVNSEANGIPDAAMLTEWAEALAKEELAQMAAAELVYRNKTYEFAMDGGEQMLQRAYGKYFRQFRSFAIEDIVRTDSLLHPIKYTIRYDFDLLGTTPILGNPTGTEFLDRARSDYFFQKDRSDHIVRVYESDAECKPISTYGPFLERPNYWTYRTTADLFGNVIWLRDISEGAD